MFGYGNGHGYGYGNYGFPSAGGFPQYPAPAPASQNFNQYAGSGQQNNGANSQKPTLQVPWVNGDVGAKAYLIAPNSCVLLMDSDNPIFYIKTSDTSGKATIQAYKYEQIQAGSAQSPLYVTREEFEQFKSTFNKEEKI